ncbi:MAG: four helix bundle protein [Saprospiraceae bacterium]|nr:four helix bundle protein [Saprospiraceae bacterium]
MTFKSFEEIEAWQLAREMCRIVGHLTAKEEFSKDWELRKQIRNASGRVMDCIAEGFERGQNNEFRNFLGISKGSCGEVRSQGYRALDKEFISEDERRELDNMAKRTAAAIQGLIDYLNRTEFRGQRYKKKPPKNTGDEFFPDTPPKGI